MGTVDSQITAHMTAWDEQRTGIERMAEMMAAYYCTLIAGGVNEQLANLLTLQYQFGLLGMAKQGGQK